MFKIGKWIGRKLECPYCGRRFEPRIVIDIVKQCPECHRYFYMQKREEGE